MEPAPQWTAEVEQSLAAVVDAVRATGRNAEAQPLWQFLRRGGRVPAGRLLRGALEGPTVYEVNHADVPSVRRAPDCAGAPPLLCASAVGHHIAAVTTYGEALCTERPREGLTAVRTPWPAAAVSCGFDVGLYEGEDLNCFAVALRRGGRAVCNWRLGVHDGDGVPAVPEAVRGLPAGDPVVSIDAGAGVAVALTASGAAYGWGHDKLFQPLGAADGAAVRIPQLSGRRVRRVRCGAGTVLAEIEEGEVAYLDLAPSRGDGTLSLLPADGALAFPLRDLRIGKTPQVVLLDAVGTWWEALIDEETSALARPRRIGVQPPPRTVMQIDRNHVLTDDGELWYSTTNGDWVSLSAANPQLPLGLQPGSCELGRRAILLPDLSCGRNRLELFARIAVRVRLPSDTVRVQLLRYAVQSCYIVGPECSPFSWPSPAAPASPGGAAPAAGS